MKGSTSLLATKLYFPTQRADLVPRPRLVGRLADGMTRKLTLVSAPAGFGKTTLLSEWRASDSGKNFAVAWLSLDEDDNHLSMFLRYLAAALEGIQTGLGDSLRTVLQSPRLSSTNLLLTPLINDLITIPFSHAIILDDFHVINSKAIHEALEFILEHLPPQTHVVILTRADPPLLLSRLRARNQLLEIRAADLEFTVEETAVFLNQIRQLRLSSEDVLALETRTEGWIAGLQLAALSMQDREDPHGFVSAFTGSHQYILDYLMDEILSKQEDQVHQFLLKTAILDRMNASLCEAITGFGNSREILEQLLHGNLFIVQLDDERHWYRYHHLFADVLRSRISHTYKEEFPDLHRSASEWFERNGLIAEALYHTLEAGDLEHAGRLVEQNAMSMLMRGELITLANWIQSVEVLIPDHPWLGIYQAWTLTLTGHLDQVESLLQLVGRRAAVINPDLGGEEIAGHIAAIRAYGANLHQDARSAIKFSYESLDHLSQGNLAIRSVVAMTLASACWADGDVQGAVSAFLDVKRMGIAAGNTNAAIGGLSSLGNLFLVQGQLQQAAETYRDAIHLATQPDQTLSPVAGAAYAGWSMVCYEWNDLETALKYAQHSVDLCQKWGSSQSLATSYIILAQARQAQGNPEKADAALRQAETLVQTVGSSTLVTGWAEAYRANFWLAKGNLEAARRWLQKHEPDSEHGIPYLRSILNRTYVRVLLAEKDLASASALLEHLLSVAEETGQTGTTIDMLVLQALVFQARSKHSMALKSLERALMLAQPEAFMRVFLDEGEPMAELLRRAGSQGIAPKYVAKLLAVFGQLPTLGLTSQQPLIDQLSEREQEVLYRIAEGLSNQEIATRLVVSVGTIKAHTASIFRKLNVTRRIQAVTRARELNLL